VAILFKTYNGRNQLHIYGEHWIVKTSVELKKILALLDVKNAKKAAVIPEEDQISISLNEIIIECKDAKDLKEKFSFLADCKIKYQVLQQ